MHPSIRMTALCQIKNLVHLTTISNQYFGKSIVTDQEHKYDTYREYSFTLQQFPPQEMLEPGVYFFMFSGPQLSLSPLNFLLCGFFNPLEFYHPQLHTSELLSLFNDMFCEGLSPFACPSEHATCRSHLVVTLVEDRVNSCSLLTIAFVILEIPITSCSPSLFMPGGNVPVHSSQ